jgi:predicted CoA-binding protein
MNQAIQDFTAQKKIAIVGASRGGKKFGNAAMTELLARGIQVLPVHPSADEIDGVKCHPNLASLRGQVDAVVVVVKPDKAVEVVREAAEAGIKQVWLQQGAQSPAAVAEAERLGISLVSGRCILMYMQPVRSFHAFHRGFERLIGRL